jgi:hypothetical protein
MCCLFTILLLLGPRFANIVWWIAQPTRWDVAFSTWIWPVLGIVFVPWTTMMYVLVAPGGVTGIDWLWIGLAIAVDVAFWTGGTWKNRGRMPSSSQPV